MNDHEAQARMDKSVALVDVLRAAGATADAVKRLDPLGWNLAATIAGVTTPSAITRALVIVTLDRAERRVDPFDGVNGEARRG